MTDSKIMIGIIILPMDFSSYPDIQRLNELVYERGIPESLYRLTVAILNYGWQFLTISSRVLLLAAVISLYSLYFAIYISLRIFIFYFWISPDLFQSDHVIENLFYDVLCSFMSIITWVPFFKCESPKNRNRMIAYYLLMTIENSVLLVIWWTKKTTYPLAESCADYNFIIFCYIIVCYISGLILMLIYYKFLHPTIGIYKQTRSERNRQVRP